MRRKRLLLSALFLLLLLFALYNSLNLLQLNENVKRAILNRAAPYIGGGLSIDRVSLGFGTLHLRGIELRDRGSAARITIRDLRISLDLRRLVATRFDFSRSVSRIEFYRPTLTLAPFADRPSTAASRPQPPAGGPAGRAAGPEALDITRFPIDTILIRRGVIALQDSQLRFLRVDDISGRLTVREGRPTFDLSGNLFNAEKRILIEGSTAPDLREFNMTAFLDYASLAEPVTLSENLILKKGDLRFTLRVSKRSETPLLLTDVTGLFTLNRLEALLPGNLTLTDFSGRLRIEDHNLTLEECGGRIFGKPLTLTGSVDNLFNPRLNLVLETPEVPLGHPELAGVLAGLKPWGSLRVRTEFTGGREGFIGQGECSSARIGLAGHVLDRPQVQFRLDRNLLRISRATARTLSGTLGLEGEVPLANPDNARFSADLRGIDLLAAVGNAHAPRASAFDAHLDWSRVGQSPKLAATLSGTMAGLEALGRLTGSIKSRDRDLELQLQNEDRALSLTGTVREWMAERRETRAKLLFRKLSPVRLNLTRASGPLGLATADGEIALSLTRDRAKLIGEFGLFGPAVSGKIYATGQISPPWSLPHWSVKLFSDTLTMAGTRGPFQAELLGGGADLELRNLRFAKTLHGNFKASPASLSGEFTLTRQPLTPELLAALGAEALRDSKTGGFIDGRVRLSGRPAGPEYEASLALTQGTLGRLTPLSVSLSLSGGPNRRVLRNLRAETPAQRFLYSDSLKLTDGLLTGSLRIVNLPLSDLTEDSLRLSGTVSLDLKSGQNRSEVSVAMDNIRVGRFQVGFLKASLTERQGVATINRLQFGNPNITGEATGFLPVPWTSSASPNRADTLSLTLSSKGDFLREIARVSGAFKDRFGARTSGNGELRLHFSGAAGRYALSDGFLDISKDKNAALYPVRVFGKITRFKGRIGIHQGQAAVDLEGLVDGSRLRVINERRWAREEPLLLEKAGLDFGVLRVITAPGGVQANAPTIIPEGEKGDFEFFDPLGNPGLIVAGPLHHPTVLGSMRVHNCRFTYPFLSEGDVSSNGPPVDWRITVVAGSNLKYYYNERKFTPMPYLNKLFKSKALKGISNFLEYPFTELTLDRNSSLTLKGAVDRHDFKLFGKITSSRGYVHYAGQDFRNDIDVGVEFDGHADNTPIIWGTASTVLRSENRSEVGREINLTLHVKDPKTGTEIPRGRFTELRLVPSSGSPFEDAEIDGSSTAYQNMLGKDFSRDPSQVTAFAMSEGKAMFEKVFLQRMITNYVERTVLSLGRQTLNPLFGADVTPDVFRIEIESDKVFNYIDMSAWSFNQFKKDFIENAEFITGKYFLGGSLFLNYSSQLDVARDPEGIEFEKLHHRLGVELTPWRYLYFNMDYEIGGIPRAMTGELNPGDFRSNVRLRLPLKLIQDALTTDNRKGTDKP